jgi:uncharacterized OB-fold protein
VDDSTTLEPTAPRSLPALTDATRAFWTGGTNGQLLIQFCTSCERWRHPPAERCVDCGGALEARPVSGRGTVFTFTVNEQQFNPEVPPPYTIAIVVLEEQDDLRLPTNLVRCKEDELAIGMPVKVLFEQHGDIAVPLFEPA